MALSMQEHKKRLEDRRKRIKKEREIIDELRVLKEKKSEEFLTQFNKYKIEDPVFYEKLLETFKSEEGFDKPVEMVKREERTGLKDIKIEEEETQSHSSNIWNTQLIIIMIAFFALITIIIIIFFLL